MKQVEKGQQATDDDDDDDLPWLHRYAIAAM